MRQQRNADGFQQVDVDLAARQGSTHSLIAFPALPNDFGSQTGVRLRMGVRYQHDARPAKVPFNIFVVGYVEGRQTSEQRLRFFAGPEPGLIILDLELDEHAEMYQLVVYANRELRGQLTLRDPHILAGATEFWFGVGRHLRRPVELARRWFQDGRRVVCQSPFGLHWAEMPDGWRLDGVHPGALAVADWLLYSPLSRMAFGVMEDLPQESEVERRPAGNEALLSFSAGTDSTAAMTLLPETVVKYYCQRAYVGYVTKVGADITLPDPAPWDARLARVPNLTILPNTFEQAQIAAGGRHGFAHPFGYAALGALLADHFDAGVLAFGSVMEQVFLRSGHLFTDVVALQSSTYNQLKRLLEGAGLFLALPTGGCSEVLTNRLSDSGRYAGVAISCPSAAADGTPCGSCFKCFRKLRIDGRSDVPEPDESVKHVFEKYPLKSATSVIYAAKRSGYRNPALDRYAETDLGFLEAYFDYAVTHMLPEPLASHARAELDRMGIRAMTPEEERRMRTIGQVFWPESFTWAKAGLPKPEASN